MPASEKRIAANRSNSMKSTGPRTPEGKERSKMNAVTHGLTAQAAVLPGEDRGQLEELSAALMRELKPDGIVQRLIAERVVSLAWKLRRVARAEEVVSRQMDVNAVDKWERMAAMREATEGRLFAQIGSKPRKRDGATILADSFPAGRGKGDDGRLIELTQYELKLDAALRAAIRELRALQKEQRQHEDVDDAEPEAAGESPAAENEANATRENDSESEISDRESRVPDPGSETSTVEPAGEKTNPTPPPVAAEVIGVTDLPGGSSAPVPRTPSSPPPGPRR